MCATCAGTGGVVCFACSGSGKMADVSPAQVAAVAAKGRDPLGRSRSGRECIACKGCGRILCRPCKGSGYM